MTSVEEKKESYSKMKSWADCSSDEESDDELHPARLAAAASKNNLDQDISYDEESEEGHISVTAEDDLDHLVPASSGGGRGAGPHGGRGNGGGRRNGNRNHREEVPYPKPIDWDSLPAELPDQPPFTAYIRNLCYKIQEPGDLADKVEGLTRWRYKKEQEVKVINARLGVDRQTGQRKGFGYVEFETPKEVGCWFLSKLF